MPAVCAVLLARRLMMRSLIGGGVALVGGVAGLWLSFFADLPTGAAIVCTLATLLMLVAVGNVLLRLHSNRPSPDHLRKVDG